jgi:toxin ParE1/3/4
MNLYIIAPSASQDLNVEAGEKLLIKFSQKCQQLAQFPN